MRFGQNFGLRYVKPYTEEDLAHLLGAPDPRIRTLLLCGHAGLRIGSGRR